jgi:uncharacterized protein YbaR (Trm112 family)/ubiquinone/menaquinone biosynthesis C-methylase UbiE
MHSALLEVLCCPGCHGGLEVAEPVEGGGGEELVEGALGCTGCGRRFEVEEGIPALGDREHMGKVSDFWSEGMLTHELYRRNIENSRQWYGRSEAFAAFVDGAAEMEGVVVDVATGPGSSFAGALVPRLREGTHFLMTDAAVHMLQGLKRAWEEEEHRAEVSFIACDGHRMPFRDESVHAFTSQDGFQCSQDDPTRSRPPRCGGAYREAYRALVEGGTVHGTCRVYAADSKTVPYLESVGSEGASWERLSDLWRAVGFYVMSRTELHRAKGKTNEGDRLPVGENDEWAVVAYVLRKG